MGRFLPEGGIDSTPPTGVNGQMENVTARDSMHNTVQATDRGLEEVHIVGQRIDLEPLKMEHVDPLYEAGRAPEIWTHLPCRIESRMDMLEWVADAIHDYEEGTGLPFIVRERSTGRIIGSLRLEHYLPQHRQIELGWLWLARDVWIKNYGSEVVLLIGRHCFEFLQVVRIHATTDVNNKKFRRMVERYGAKLEGVFRKHRIMADGRIRDSAYYSLIDDDWPSAMQSLIALVSDQVARDETGADCPKPPEPSWKENGSLHT